MDKFMEFIDAGKTILFVTHDVNSVKRFCSRAIWLNQGKLIMDGNTDEVTDKYLDFLKSELPMDEFLAQQATTDINKEEAQAEAEHDVSGIDIVKINDLRMYDTSGKEITEINHGDKVTLRVSYLVSDESIEDAVLGVAIRRIDNEYICGINTKLDQVKIPWKKGYNSVILQYDNFSLIGGEYYFDVGIFEKTGIVNIDYKAKIRSFFVKMDYIGEGVVILDHSWRA